MTTARDAAGAVAAFCGHEQIRDEVLDFLLWERTPFPVCDWQETVDALVRELGATAKEAKEAYD
jgi:hypothetical protein